MEQKELLKRVAAALNRFLGYEDIGMLFKLYYAGVYDYEDWNEIIHEVPAHIVFIYHLLLYIFGVTDPTQKGERPEKKDVNEDA